MSEHTSKSFNKENKSSKQPGKFVRKSGKTLLAKAHEGSTIEDSWLEGLAGMKSMSKTEKGAIFFSFDTKDNALAALKHLRQTHEKDLMVKFAHYRLFFTINGLTDESDYNEVKEKHIKWVEENTDASVLYYKLYRNKSYLNCGDFTIDTKEALDKLLSTEEGGLKEYSFGDEYNGKFYRYNRNPSKKEGGKEQVENL